MCIAVCPVDFRPVGSDWGAGYKVPHTRHDVCIDEEARTDGDGRHFERLGTHLQAQGEKGSQ